MKMCSTYVFISKNPVQRSVSSKCLLSAHAYVAGRGGMAGGPWRSLSNYVGAVGFSYAHSIQYGCQFTLNQARDQGGGARVQVYPTFFWKGVQEKILVTGMH